MANLVPLYQPLGEGFALRDSGLTDASLELVRDPSESDPDLKKCRSMKPGPLGCNGFRVTDSDYCQGHKKMIEAEQAAHASWVAAGSPE